MAENRKTTMGHITQEHLKQSRIAIPSKELTIELDKIIEPLFAKKINNEIEQKISINTDSFKTNLRNLKSKITNDPFGQSSIFNESSIIEIHNIFEFIKKDIFLQKVRFYK